MNKNNVCDTARFSKSIEYEFKQNILLYFLFFFIDLMFNEASLKKII